MSEKSKYLALQAAEGPQTEPTVTVTIPESIYHLYNAIYEQPAEGSSPSFLAQAKWSSEKGQGIYELPESCTDLGNPRGVQIGGRLDDSIFYPGTGHDYFVYLPPCLAPFVKDGAFDAESYEAARAAEQAFPENTENGFPFVLILDGQHYTHNHATGEAYDYLPEFLMLDNLAAEGRIPQVIAVMACYGEPGPGQPMNGFTEGVVNRSYEYDRLGSWFSEFLLKEMLPAAITGLPVTADPARNVISGMSTSGTGAFQTAWYHPDIFGSVITAFPAYVNIRGGHILPSVVRIEEPRPVRIFQVTGKYDLNNYFGNWHIGSLDMGLALAYKGYDHRMYATESGHDFNAYHLTLQEGLAWALCGTETEAPGLAKISFDDQGLFAIES